MQHLSQMAWDFEDQLQMVDKGGGCKAHYVYDDAGQRVRKVIEQNGTRKEERIYLGSFEIYHKYNGSGSTVTLERETLHIMDDTRDIALVDTRTHGNDGSPDQGIRYQFTNHLGSAALELDENARTTSYEEYYPYGSTSNQAVRKDIEVPLKRYRYMGKERDEETGLYYYGARYYAAWLGRWTSCDPSGGEDDINIFEFVGSNPINFVDPSGMQREGWTNDQQKFLRNIGKMSKEDARKHGIPSHIQGYIKNELRRTKQMAKKIREHGGRQALRGKYKDIKTTSTKLRSPFKGQYDVGHKKAHVMGGSNKSENLHMELSSDNRRRGPRERIANKKIKARKVASMKVPNQPKGPAGLVSKATTVSKGAKASSLPSKVAPALKAVGKTLAPVARVAGKVLGPLGIGLVGYQVATAETTEEKVDAGISVVSTGLLMSKNPVAMAGGAGLAAGQLIDNTLDASSSASSAGMFVNESLQSMGANKTFSVVAGGVATVAAVPNSIVVAGAHKAYQGAKWAWNKIF